MTKNPSHNTYYWRAVHRLAKRRGISISKARKLDWQKEANAERKRRSKAAIEVHSRHATQKGKRKILVDVRRTGRKAADIGREVPVRRKGVREVFTDAPRRKLDLRDYDQITPQDEEEFEESEDYQEQWEADFEGEWEELNDLDNLDGFMQDFEYEDSDQYKEPV